MLLDLIDPTRELGGSQNTRPEFSINRKRIYHCDTLPDEIVSPNSNDDILFGKNTTHRMDHTETC